MDAWQVQDQISGLVKKYKPHVDFFAIRLERSQGADIFLRSGKVETLSTGISIGGQVRACHRGGWGFASFNDLHSLEAKLKEAIAAAKWVGNEETVLADVEPVQAKVSLIQENPHQVELITKKNLCAHYTDILRSVSDRVVSASVRYGDCTQQVIFATSEGTMIEQEWADWELRCSAIARSGDTVQTGRETFG
jgi:TldD protein